MKRHPHLVLASLLIVVLALAVMQGRKLDRIREAEMLYRWVQASADQYRVEGTLSDAGRETSDKPSMDTTVFMAVADEAEEALPPIPLTEEDYREDGEPFPKLVRAVRMRDTEMDWAIWELVSSPELADTRRDFLTYLRQKQIATVGSDVNIQAAQEAGVNMANLFFGFRMLAANFVWLKVDSYYHQGMMHRMIPLMNTCVALDPNFVDAFLLGAWHLSYNISAGIEPTPEPLKQPYPKYKKWLGEKELYYHKGIDFLLDGIRKNPREYKLYFDLGFGIYHEKLDDNAMAVKYLSEAMRQRHDSWVPRTLYRCMQLNNQYEDALAGWQDYLAKNPGHDRAIRFIAINRGLIAEREARKALVEVQEIEQSVAELREQIEAKHEEADQAREQGDETRALELETQAEALERRVAEEEARVEAARTEHARHYREAQRIWIELGGDDPENPDPFAMAHLLEMRARAYAQQERYMEAIALLDKARFSSNERFYELSDLIIEYKQKGNLPLTQSEIMAVARQKEKAELDRKRAGYDWETGQFLPESSASIEDAA